MAFPLVLLGLSGIAFAIHCGDSADNSEFDDVVDPCKTIYEGICGTACTTDNDCPDGLFCGSDMKCTAQCAPNQVCQGAICSPKGRCGVSTDPPVPFGDGGSNDGSSDANVDAVCADTNVTLTPVIPKVLFLLDQSSSMLYYQFPGANPSPDGCASGCRWTVLKDAMIGPDGGTGGVVKTLQAQAELGVQLFSATDSNPNDGDNSHLTGPTDMVCPHFNGKKFVPTVFALNNFAAIDALLRPAGVDDDTPTGPAILTVSGLGADGGIDDDAGFAAINTTAPKVIVLVTDGEPGLCGDNNTSDPAKAAVVLAVQQAFKQKIQTYVIAIGDNSSAAATAHFKAVANAGQGMDPTTGDAGAILPSNPAQLVSALQNIVLNARTCSFTLSGMVQAGSESLGTVTLNGAKIPYNTADGWVLKDPSTLVLQGASCNTLKTTPAATLSATFPCGAVTPAVIK